MSNNKVVVVSELERDTKNKHVYKEVESNLEQVTRFGVPAIASLYVHKMACIEAFGKAPTKVRITIEAVE